MAGTKSSAGSAVPIRCVECSVVFSAPVGGPGDEIACTVCGAEVVVGARRQGRRRRRRLLGLDAPGGAQDGRHARLVKVSRVLGALLLVLALVVAWSLWGADIMEALEAGVTQLGAK